MTGLGGKWYATTLPTEWPEPPPWLQSDPETNPIDYVVDRARPTLEAWERSVPPGLEVHTLKEEDRKVK